MIKRISCRLLFVGLFFLTLSYLLTFSVAASDVANKNRIVVVGDISQSLSDVSGEVSLINSLKLAIDLAPNQSEVALLTVDTAIISETEFLKLSQIENREKMKAVLDSSAFVGGTNLVLGVEAAVEKLGSEPGRVLMIADISDNALTRSTDFTGMIDRAVAAAKKAKNSGIIIDLILVGEADTTSELVNAYLSIPNSTGGKLIQISNANELSSAVERHYFEVFDYNLYPITGVKSTDVEQEIDITMPTRYMSRSRIYVSATTTIEGLHATYATAELSAEVNSSYGMIDLSQPAQEGVKLYLNTGDNPSTKIYLIADYDISTVVDTKSELIKEGKESIQKTTVDLTFIDKFSEKPMFIGDERSEFIPQITMIAPSGKKQSLGVVPNPENQRSYVGEFFPEEFGEYQLFGSVDNGEFSLPLPVTTLTADELVKPKTWIMPTLISVIIASALIIGAIIFYIHQKKKKSTVIQGAVELERSYIFTGKLHFATILAEGGKREIQPFTFYLEKMSNRKRLSMDEIYTASSHAHHFSGMDKIWITPGPRDSIILKNNSQSVILHSGKEYGHREKVQIFYNDKLFIVFEKDEDEIEILYKQARPIRSNVTASKISVSVS